MAEPCICQRAAVPLTPAAAPPALAQRVPALVHELRNAIGSLAMGLELANLCVAAAGSKEPSLRPQVAGALARAEMICSEFVQLARPVAGPTPTAPLLIN